MSAGHRGTARLPDLAAHRAHLEYDNPPRMASSERWQPCDESRSQTCAQPPYVPDAFARLDR